MATMRLIPSTYYLSSSSYLSISDAANMYTDTDSDTYSTTTNSRSSTTSYYIYLRGFNFSALPENAIVSSFAVKFKARESGVSTSSSYRPYMCNNTSTITGTCSAVSTTATVQTFSGVTATWDTIKEYGANFGIRFNCRRASSGTTSYLYLYGAEIEVTYTVPVAATVTSTLSGSGTIDPSGAYSCYEGDEYTLTITPTTASNTVSATRNGVDITSQLVRQTGQTVTSVPDDVATSGIQSGSQYAEYCVGHSAESPTTTGTTSNMYASQNATGYAEYSFGFSDIPSGVEITDIEVRAYGHRENATIDSTHVSSVAIYNSGTAISSAVEFPNTSNSLITITPTTIPSSLSGVTVRHTVGYYGGLVLGISFDVTYEVDGVIYTYTYTVTGDATIAVTISGSGETSKLYVKISGVWTEATPYKKVSGAWVQQTDVTTVFDSTNKYKQGATP